MGCLSVAVIAPLEAAPLLAPAVTDAPMAPANRARVLLVEDERAVRTMLASYLGSIGFDVTTATEPEEASALLEHRPFDALLTDLGLTGLNRSEGLDVLRLARYHNASLRIVVFTGSANEEVHAACLREGADLVLLKPQPLAIVGQALRDNAQVVS